MIFDVRFEWLIWLEYLDRLRETFCLKSLWNNHRIYNKIVRAFFTRGASLFRSKRLCSRPLNVMRRNDKLLWIACKRIKNWITCDKLVPLCPFFPPVSSLLFIGCPDFVKPFQGGLLKFLAANFTSHPTYDRRRNLVRMENICLWERERT